MKACGADCTRDRFGVDVCGTDCTRDRSCVGASGSLGVCESASVALGRSIAHFMDLLGDHEKKLEKNPFCAAFAICSVFESALGDVGITIVNDGSWESRSAWLIGLSET